MSDFVRCIQRTPSSSGPDEQKVRPYLLHARVTSIANRTLPTVVGVSAGVGLTGSRARSIRSTASCTIWPWVRSLVAIAVLGPLGTGLAAAAPRDAGPTLPIEAFLVERPPEGPRTELVSDMAVAFPVVGRGLRQLPLRAGASLPKAYARWLTQPIALVADDAPSRRWLAQQGDALKALGAAVLVVRVASSERMRELRAHRADLPMAPSEATELVAALQGARAAVYPLVILSDGSLVQDVRALVSAPPTLSAVSAAARSAR